MASGNKRRPAVEPQKRSLRGNARFPKRDRQQRMRGMPLTAGPGMPALIPVAWLNSVVGVALLPFTVITTITFFTSFAQAAVDQSVWRLAPVFFFCWGLVIWLGVFAAGLRPRWLYVLGHELTHAFFVILCGGRIHDFKVGRDGGHVIADKNNLLIALSPYFVPFWSLIVTALYGLSWAVADLGKTHHGFWLGHGLFRWDWVLFFAIGYTWGLHFTFTTWMLARDQPDLRHNGKFFSLIIIYSVNLLLIASLLVAASPELTWSRFADEWARHLKTGWRIVTRDG
jgi:hypothetical protein